MLKILRLFLIIFCFQGFIRAENVPTSAPETVHPVVILGGGIGALTSAIYLQRAGIDVLVIEGMTPGGAIAQSPLVENWPGEVQISGFELAEKIKNQAQTNGATIYAHEVINVDFSTFPYTIRTRDLINRNQTHTFKTYTCIIALGTKPKHLQIPGEMGEKDYWTRGVYNCATCDGALFKNKNVAVIGGGDSAIIEAEHLSKIASKVFIIVRAQEFHSLEKQRAKELLKKPNVQVLFGSTVEEIQGDGKKVSHLLINQKQAKKQRLAIDGVFLAIGSTPNTQLFVNQLELDSKGYIVLKKDQETSKKGIFAIGDIVDPVYRQAISAAGDGARAAMQVEHELPTLAITYTSPMINPVAQKSANSASVTELTSINQFQHALKNNTIPILVDFYSPSCGPCRQLSPILEEKAKIYQERIKFYKVNINVLSQLVKEYRLDGVPTVLVFSKNGSLIDRRVGLDKIQDLLDHLDNISKK